MPQLLNVPEIPGLPEINLRLKAVPCTAVSMGFFSDCCHPFFFAFLSTIYKIIMESEKRKRRLRVYLGFDLIFIFNTEALK